MSASTLSEEGRKIRDVMIMNLSVSRPMAASLLSITLVPNVPLALTRLLEPMWILAVPIVVLFVWPVVARLLVVVRLETNALLFVSMMHLAAMRIWAVIVMSQLCPG